MKKTIFLVSAAFIMLLVACGTTKNTQSKTTSITIQTYLKDAKVCTFLLV